MTFLQTSTMLPNRFYRRYAETATSPSGCSATRLRRPTFSPRRARGVSGPLTCGVDAYLDVEQLGVHSRRAARERGRTHASL